MNEFRETFRKVARVAIDGLNIPASLDFNEEKDSLVIPKQNENGFSVSLECLDYGVYTSAEGWHGGCWDVTAWEPQRLEKVLKEFIKSILNDAFLEIRYSNSKPYKWIMHYQFEGEWVSDETGLLFYNWFGTKSKQEFCNGSTT